MELAEKLAHLKEVASATGEDLCDVAFWLESLPGIQWTEEQRKILEAMKRIGAH